MVRKLGLAGLAALLITLTSCATARTTTTDLDLGNQYLRDGRHDAAAQVYDDVVRLDPQNVAAWNNRGIARVRLGQTVAALGDYTHAIDLSPRDPELYVNRGDAYVLLGNYDYAIQDFTRATQLAPQYAKAYFNRGTARLRNGDREGAQADWHYAISIEPDPWAQAAMVRSAGLGAPPVRAAVNAIPSTVPSRTPVVAAPSASPRFESAAPRLDATALAARGVTRHLNGDRAGAVDDLRAALAVETDTTRRASLERFLRVLEETR